MSSTDVASLMVRAGYGEVDGEDVTRSSSAVRVPASPRMEGGGETPPSRYGSHLPWHRSSFLGQLLPSGQALCSPSFHPLCSDPATGE